MTDKIKLLPCPFCGKALQINQRKHNPFARCATAGCVGGKLPLLNIELAEDVEAWNRRAALAQQPAAAVPHLTAPELSDLMDFHSAVCCDEGHTVKKEGMRRLAQIGAVESVGFGKHRLTEFGVYLLAAAPAAPVAADQAPIKLSDDVREFLQEWIDSTMGGEDADVDYDFANQLAVLLGPIYAAPPAAEPAPCKPAQAAAVPDGWKLVPVEPTREMWAAAGDCVTTLQWSGIGRHDKISSAVYRAMLAAAPAAPVAQEPVAWALIDRGGLVRLLHKTEEASRSAEARWAESYSGCSHVPLYTAAPADQQPDTVAVPRELLDRAARSCANGWVDYHTARELRALLGKEGE